MKLFLKNNRFRSLPQGAVCSQSGFTLLEVMIAMTIMVIALASIYQAASTSISATEKVKNFNTLALLARNQVLKTEYEIEGKKFGDINKEDGGGFEEPYQDFRWSREVKEVEFPNISGGAQSAEGESGDSDKGGGGQSDMMGMIGKNVTGFLSKAIREITVTVYWKRAGGELKYSVSSYWVNLNHEFSIAQ